MLLNPGRVVCDDCSETEVCAACVERMRGEVAELTHEQMARYWRYAPAGHLYFACPAVYRDFLARFTEFGGMTPELSKRIGWEG